LTRPGAAPLLQRNPLIDAVLVTQHGELPATLRVQSFDVVLCPDAEPETAGLAAAVTAGARRGYVMDPRGRVVSLGSGAEHWFRMGVRDDLKRLNQKTYMELMQGVLELRTAVAEPPILELSDSERAAAAAFAGAAGLVDGRPLIGLNTGAGGRWEYKRWTHAHQVAWLRLMCASGKQVLLLGGPEETERHAELMAACRGLPVFDGGTGNSMRAFAAKVDLCDLVVTGDTMALHIAVARRKPVVALFGPTSATEIHLYGRGEKIAPADLDCLCCYLPRCDRQPYCQELIEPSQVAAAVERLLR
jgi:heptosyltransferase-2